MRAKERRRIGRAGAVHAELRWLKQAFDEHDLLTRASAIAFQVLSALVPLALFGLALAGFMHLEGAWQHFADRQLRPELSATAFAFMKSSVAIVLGHHTAFWLTTGLVVAVWELSGAVRAVMGGLIRIRRRHEQRTLRRRLAISLCVTLGVTGCMLAAAGLVVVGNLVHPGGTAPDIAWLALRWTLAALLMVAAVSLLFHTAPCSERPIRRRSLGAGITTVIWMVTSAGFLVYVRELAGYDSIFGSLAVLFVLASYLYIAAIAFLVGAVVDERIRTGVPVGVGAGSPEPSPVGG